MVEIPIQVNGKLRDKIVIPENTPEEQIKEMALKLDKVLLFIQDQPIRKWIYVPNRTVNIVI
jgi:leucyl-tRNA synthetase